MNDVKFALRQPRKSPGFTLVAVLTLALGIGLNTTIFSLVNDLFLRRLPFKEPSRIVHLDNGGMTRELADVGISAPRYQLYRDGQTIFDGFAAENSAAQNSSSFTLTGLGDPVQIFGGRVTSNYFDVLGVRPILGRNFLPKEEESADVALVTKNFWQKRLGGDPNVIGRSITLDGTPHTIVGVLPNMPAAWFGANPIAEVWTTKPFQIPGFSHEQLMRGSFFLRVVGRLKPGVTVQQARAALPSLEESSRVHDRIVDLDRLVDGDLPGASGFTRRFDRRLERRRPRHTRQCAPTALPQNPRRRTSRVVGHAIGRRSIAHHELHPLKSAKPRLPFPESLDGCDYTADLAVPRPSVASKFC